VAAGDGFVPDWRDAAAYEPLIEADRSLFAWEWLRRDRNYRAAAERALEAGGIPGRGDPAETPERWGLHAFEPPGRMVPEARPVWSVGVHPYVLVVEAGPPEGGDVLDLERFARLSTLIAWANGREHLLISDGYRAIRLDVVSGSLADGPVELRYRLSGLATAERPLLTLRRLLALWRTGRLSRSLHPEEARARRLLLMLRAQDALGAGANQRTIAAELLGGGATRERWRVEASSVRSQVQRLVRGARRMAEGGFRQLLR